MVDSFVRLWTRCRDLDPKAEQSSEPSDPAEARRWDWAGSGGQISQPNGGVQTAHLADEERGRPRVQSVPVGDCEDRYHIGLLSSNRCGR